MRVESRVATVVRAVARADGAGDLWRVEVFCPYCYGLHTHGEWPVDWRMKIGTEQTPHCADDEGNHPVGTYHLGLPPRGIDVVRVERTRHMRRRTPGLKVDTARHYANLAARRAAKPTPTAMRDTCTSCGEAMPARFGQWCDECLGVE